MNYFGMPFGMWTLLAKSFRTQLTKIFGYNDESVRDITHKAKAKYKEKVYCKGYCCNESYRCPEGS